MRRSYPYPWGFKRTWIFSVAEGKRRHGRRRYRGASNAYIGSSPLRVCALFSHFPKNDEKSPIDTPLRKAALPGGFNAYIGSSPLRVCALFSHFPKNDEKSLIDAPPWKTALPWYLKENKVTLRYPTFL
jgi:hypothetical protein